MSFGGGFGGFGQNNNNNSTGSTFGGFGSNNTNSGGFGSNNTGFGANNNTNTGGSLFGNNSTANTGFGGFGSSGNAFGQNKTGFGSTATSGSSLFGGNTATSGTTGFGGFGGGNTSSGFGSNNTNSLFGGAKTTGGFGTSTATPASGGLFGGSGTTGGGFGSTTTGGSAFGGFSGGSTNQNNGTGNVQFAESSEKDTGAAGNQMIKYQSITTMDAYKPFSFEELRLVDYTQGRKQGNANGQAGGFGTSTGFGTGFGNNNNASNAFGGTNNNTTSLFGQNNSTASTGFGANNTTGGLFGASKPATGGLFGSTTTSAPSGGGLFGSSGSTAFGGGFGQNTTSSGTTGGLFGTAQNKPAFGGFGSTTNTTTGTGTGFGGSTGGFGSNNNSGTTGGLFGNNNNAATTTGFGGNNQAQSSGFSFGQNNQNQQQPAQTGGLFGNFGNNNNSNQQKPGGLFGSTTTPATGGLFGNNQQTQQTGGLFGNNNQAQQTGGLFGNKPATGGLFGNSTTQQTGGLFGSSNTQPQQTGGLFGNSNNQQSGGLFGNKPATGGLGSSLFGNTQQNQQQPAGNSLFGNSQSNNQPLGGSLFGSQMQPQPQQPGTLTASLLQNPYGNDALFANIGTPTQSVGPLATPLASSQKNKKQALIPAYKISPAASNRLTTPQKRPTGYGFSYSTYGTPGSALPGSPFGSSAMLNAPLGRSLNKSMSTSNLRHSFNPEDSILNPAAFSSTVRGGTGRLKKLNVDRNLTSGRKPLFGTNTPEPRKSVSFSDANGLDDGDSSILSPTNGALVRTETPSPPAQRNGSTHGNGSTNRASDLPTVAEDAPPAIASAPAVQPPKPAQPAPSKTQSAKPSSGSAVRPPSSHADEAKGDYYCIPSIAQLKAMPASELKKVTDFEVGRQGSGRVIFHKPDLTAVPLDKLLGQIVVFDTRNISVYQDQKVTPKPLPGKGLNVPSTITLGNAWPRANAGATEVFEKKGSRVNKHTERLKKMKDTTFINYNVDTGEWTFQVDHYTTYGLPDDEDDESMLDDSIIHETIETPAHLKTNLHSDASLPSPPDSSPDDTFDFKKGKRKLVPGEFDSEMEGMEVEGEDLTGSVQSFLGARSVGSSVLDGEDASELGQAEDEEMAGSFPKPTRSTEQVTATASLQPKSILKNSIALGTPSKSASALFGHDWTEQLQRTVSPKKQDRAALRAHQSSALKAPEDESVQTTNGRGQPFATSMDIMNSLFKQSTRTGVTTRSGASTLGSEYPNKRHKRDAAETEELDDAFHHSTKPQWGPDGTLVYVAQPMAAALGKSGFMGKHGASIVGEHNDIRFAKLSGVSQDATPATLLEQQNCTDITFNQDTEMPQAVTNDDFEFVQFAELAPMPDDAGRMEQRAWELAHLLYDDMHLSNDAPTGRERDLYLLRLRKDRVSEFWKKIVRNDVQKHVAKAESQEEKAFAYLTGGLIEEACNALVESKNFHLATLVAQIGCDRRFREAMSSQIESWRQLNVLAEFEDPIRAIYELLAGNTCICRGKPSPGTENVTSTFTFATRFDLDWRRSFGLRLWYGIDPEQDVTEAVLKYLEDLKDGSEEARPQPWFIEQRITTGWNDTAADTREDLLWSLLQLYAGDSFDLAAAFAPEAISGNPLDARLSFQLITLFQAQKRGIAAALSPSTIDALATTFATSLATTIEHRPNALVSACWVLLHLSDPNARRASISALLDQHAALLDPPEGELYRDLLALRIPDKLIYLSKALYARAVLRDPVAEAQNLLLADEWNRAHEVVCHTVGPLAVIENDSDSLRELLGGLHDPIRGHPGYKAEWDVGAGIYYDFVEMRDLERQRGQRWKELVAKLAKALGRVANELEGKELRERAALQIMGNTVAGYAVEGVGVLSKGEALRVPLTEDWYLAQSRALGLEYYRALVAAK